MPIRIDASWSVTYHELHDEAPVIEDGVCTNLSEDLFQASRGIEIIDAGFYRDRYRVMLISNSDWQRPVRSEDCSDRSEVVRLIENWCSSPANVA